MPSWKVNRNSVSRVVVLFPGSLGDFICLLPTLEAVRGLAHGQALELVARGEALELAQSLPWIHQVCSLEERVFSQLFSASEDISEELLQFFSAVSEVFSWYGTASPEVTNTLNRAVSGRVWPFAFFSGQKNCHATAYYLRCIGIPTLHCASFPLGRKTQQWLEQYWKQQNWSLTARTLVIHPGSGGQRKCWEREGFVQVARWWKEHTRGQVLILLGPAEGREGGHWRQIGTVVDSFPLWQVAALLSRADIYLGNDSGVSHLAGAVGARGVILFGPTRPQQWKPLGGSLVVIQNAAYRTLFPEVAGMTLAEIPVEQVLAQLLVQGS
jgi:ADP-heptose:LPS heptosyltransferase